MRRAGATARGRDATAGGAASGGSATSARPRPAGTSTTVPHTTHDGCHDAANGTSTSARPKWTYESRTIARDVHADEDDGEPTEEAVEIQHPCGRGTRRAGAGSTGRGPRRRSPRATPRRRCRRRARCTTRAGSSRDRLRAGGAGERGPASGWSASPSGTTTSAAAPRRSTRSSPCAGVEERGLGEDLGLPAQRRDRGRGEHRRVGAGARRGIDEVMLLGARLRRPSAGGGASSSRRRRRAGAARRAARRASHGLSTAMRHAAPSGGAPTPGRRHRRSRTRPRRRARAAPRPRGPRRGPCRSHRGRSRHRAGCGRSRPGLVDLDPVRTGDQTAAARPATALGRSSGGDLRPPGGGGSRPAPEPVERLDVARTQDRAEQGRVEASVRHLVAVQRAAARAAASRTTRGTGSPWARLSRLTSLVGMKRLHRRSRSVSRPRATSSRARGPPTTVTSAVAPMTANAASAGMAGGVRDRSSRCPTTRRWRTTPRSPPRCSRSRSTTRSCSWWSSRASRSCACPRSRSSRR